MSLNIKNERVHNLVRELAELTHQNQTSAVEQAVQRMIDHVRRDQDARIARINAVVERVAPLLKDGPGSQDIDELLYDEYGLPK